MKVWGRKFLLEAIASAVLRIGGGGSSFLLALVAGRVLGSAAAGYFLVSIGFVTFFSAFARLGLDYTIVRFTAASGASGDCAKVVVRKALAVAVPISLFICLVLLLGSYYLSSYFENYSSLGLTLMSICPAIICVTLLTIFSMSFQGLGRHKASILYLSVMGNFIAAMGLLLPSKLTSEGAATIYTISTLATAIASFIWWKSVVPSPASATLDWDDIFSSCLPLWIVMLMTQLVQWSSQFIATIYTSASDVALLASAQRTAMLTSFIWLALNVVVSPKIASFYKNGDSHNLYKLAVQSTWAMIGVSLPIFISMLLFPSYIMSIFGSGFEQGGALLRVLAIGQFVNVATGAVGFFLSMSGHEKDLRNSVLISGGVAIVGALIFIPRYGALGGACTSAAAVATQNLMNVWLVYRRLGFLVWGGRRPLWPVGKIG